jgi:hypothetical protein
MDENIGDGSVEKSQRIIRIVGYVFALMFVMCLYTIYVSVIYFSSRHVYFGAVIGIWYLLTAIGLFTRKKFGYYSLKLFLYILLVGFPIGTIISYKMLKYIKKNNIVNHFKSGYSQR